MPAPEQKKIEQKVKDFLQYNGLPEKSAERFLYRFVLHNTTISAAYQCCRYNRDYRR